MPTLVGQEIRKRIYERYGGRCAICGLALTMDKDRSLENDYVQIDHIMPRHLGGSNHEDNLRPLCRPCNSKRKGTTGIELISIYEKELKDFYAQKTKRMLHYLYSAKNGVLTKEQLEYIESLISRRRQLEDDLIRRIKEELDRAKK